MKWKGHTIRTVPSALPGYDEPPGALHRGGLTARDGAGRRRRGPRPSRGPPPSGAVRNPSALRNGCGPRGRWDPRLLAKGSCLISPNTNIGTTGKTQPPLFVCTRPHSSFVLCRDRILCSTFVGGSFRDPTFYFYPEPSKIHPPWGSGKVPVTHGGPPCVRWWFFPRDRPVYLMGGAQT